MIDSEEWDRVKAMVKAIQRGKYLTSDRVANRVDDLAEMTTTFPWSNPSDFAEGFQLAPQQMREHFDRVDELRFLLGEIEAAMADVPVEAYGKPETF